MKKLLLVLLTVCAFSIPAWAAVDLNTATQSQLEGLSGVGPKKAEAIIEYRKKNGSFKSVDELDKVPGFGAKTVAKLKKDLTIGNAKAPAPNKSVKMKAKPVAMPVKDKVK